MQLSSGVPFVPAAHICRRLQGCMPHVDVEKQHPSVQDTQVAAQMFRHMSLIGCTMRPENAATDMRSDGNAVPSANAPMFPTSLEAQALNLVVNQVSLGAFQRGRKGPTLKTLVPPASYPHILKSYGQEPAVPFPDDPEWLYRARLLLNLPHMFAHDSITRCASSDTLSLSLRTGPQDTRQTL